MDWMNVDRFDGVAAAAVTAFVPLPTDVTCYAVAASLCAPYLGDGLVEVDSALGRFPSEASRTLQFQDVYVVSGVNHCAMIGDDRVLARMRVWLRLGNVGGCTSSECAFYDCE